MLPTQGAKPFSRPKLPQVSVNNGMRKVNTHLSKLTGALVAPRVFNLGGAVVVRSRGITV